MHSKVVDESKPELSVSFNWLRLVLLIIALPLFLALGFWQLDRADQKEQILLEYGSASRVLSDAGDVTRMLGGRQLLPVTAVVDLDDSRYLLLDNRTRQGKVGYEVIVPIRIGQGSLLANLGWVEGNPDRRILPQIEIPKLNAVEVDAVLAMPENLMQLSQVQEDISGWPKRIQAIDISQISEHLGASLEQSVLRLTTPLFQQITPHQATLNSMPPEKHIGYAVQWFGLAFALTVWLFLTSGWIRRIR